jgi:hypothetical protein
LGERWLEERFEEGGYSGGVHGEQWSVGSGQYPVSGTQSTPTPMPSHSTVICFRDSFDSPVQLLSFFFSLC